jgi:hypothetical protein
MCAPDRPFPTQNNDQITLIKHPALFVSQNSSPKKSV